MSDCCPASVDNIDAVPKKYRCPVNGKFYTGVARETIFHHLNRPWEWQLKHQGYYFCDDPECEVVYFGQDDSVIKQSELRTRVGIKEQTEQSIICYCFGVSFKDARTDSEAKQFVLEKTKESICACGTRNPSGKCCLKDFPKT